MGSVKRGGSIGMVRHGISIGIERVDNQFFLSLKIAGKLTHEDYEKINPMIDAALEGVKDPKIHAFIDASELEGWELMAAWDDFKLGLKHGGEFEKIAILGNNKWQEYTSKIASWFIAGQVEHFENADDAILWLHD